MVRFTYDPWTWIWVNTVNVNRLLAVITYEALHATFIELHSFTSIYPSGYLHGILEITWLCAIGFYPFYLEIKRYGLFAPLIVNIMLQN